MRLICWFDEKRGYLLLTTSIFLYKGLQKKKFTVSAEWVDGVGREEKEIRGLKSLHRVYHSSLKYASIVWHLGFSHI